ncbi:DUF1090 domain-containing protein [Leminorella grimontii]|uniref:DUF1090 domain-containing protein n=1 Tax=Leminorella grimontii TaxID=82981 RepID=UPI0032207C46
MFKKFILILPLMASSAAVVAGSHYEGKDHCQIKKEKIAQQMEYARQYNNPYRLAGLERAMRNVEAHCNSGEYRVNQEEKVANKERKVAERRAELAEAQASGKPEKVANKTRKLKEAEAELDEALSLL